MTKQKIKLALLAFVLMGAATVVQAQGGPGDPGLDPDPPPPTEIPFDGGLSLVLAAGVAYAAKKGFDKRKKHRSE
jgi:hypothetical protein